MVGAPGTDYRRAGARRRRTSRARTASALLTVSKEQDAARAMIKFMISPEAAPLLRKVHEEPAKS